MKRRLLTLVISGTLLTAIGPVVHASSIDVSYYNTNKELNIYTPIWVIEIPSSIRLLKTDRTLDTTIKLVAINNDLPEYIQAKVSVKSQTGYKIDEASDISYKLKYEGIDVFTGQLKLETIAILTNDSQIKNGQAKIIESNEAIDEVKDILTYEVERIE